MGNVHRLGRKTEHAVNNTPSRRRAAIVSAGLSILFVIVYGSCNWITAHRAHVGMFYFEWERGLPFVPFLIPAYLSLDLFFIGAPFLCKTSDELRTFARRITAAILVAGICFLLFPLRFAFERPHAAGVVGFIFDRFRSLDAPYNLVPCLHAALLLLVADVYMRHLRGWFRTVSIGWFVLIALSPVLTYQHHVIDILGGILLALACFYFLPEAAQPWPAVRNARAGVYYLCGASFFLALAFTFRGWAICLLWPAFAVATVGASYFGFGRNIYRKTNGRLPWIVRVLLAPCLLGQYISLYYYRRRGPLWDPVTPRVWIGGRLSNRQAQDVVLRGVRAVLDLTAEFSEPKCFRDVCYRNIPVPDLTAPNQKQLVEMAQFIGDQTRHGIVYVHCKIGYSRSAAAVAAYLLYADKVRSTGEAFAIIRQARPSVVIRPEVIAGLDRFQRELRETKVSKEIFVLASADQALA